MDDRQVILGTITLNIPIRCPLDVLGEGFHTEIGEIKVKLGLPEQFEDSESLQAPAIASRYGIQADWGRIENGVAYVRSMFYGCQTTEDEAEQLHRSSTNWIRKLENLNLLMTAITEPIHVNSENRVVRKTMYRMSQDGSLTVLYDDVRDMEETMEAPGILLDREKLQSLLDAAASPEVIRQPYTVFLNACRALVYGDCYSAGVLGGTAAELAGGEYIAAHSEEISPHVQELMLGNAREEQFEQLAQMGLIIPGDWENRIIGVYTDMRYGRITPDTETLRQFLLDCGRVIQLCIPEYLV